MSRIKRRTIGQATETEIALPVTVVKRAGSAYGAVRVEGTSTGVARIGSRDDLADLEAEFADLPELEDEFARLDAELAEGLVVGREIWWADLAAWPGPPLWLGWVVDLITGELLAGGIGDDQVDGLAELAPWLLPDADPPDDSEEG
jgi:hypothetical protein